MASTYLTSGNLSSAGNQKKWTFSAWLKKATTGVDNAFFGYYVGSTNYFIGQWRSDDLLRFGNVDGGSWSVELAPNAVYRDLNAWYHVVFQYDSAQATSSNRASLWVNGEKQSSFATEVYPSQNANTKIPNAGYPITIGRGTKGSNTYYLDGCMSHVHFCDGYAYQASDFGSTDAVTGEWKIKTSPSVSYGTNGFFVLKDGNSVTDQSGQGNNFTVAGGTLTKTEDCPSNVFATFNSLFVLNAPSTTNFGNTRIDQSSSAWRSQITTIGASSGKYYAEFKAGTISSGSPYKYNMFGVVNDEISQGGNFDYIGMSDYGWGLNWNNNLMHSDSNQSGSFSSFTTGDIISVAMDLDNYKAYWRKNGGAWDNSADPTSGSTGTGAISLDSNKIYFFGASVYGNECLANFGNGYFGTTAVSSAGTNASGNGIFEYDVPTGYTALSTKGLNL